MRFQGRHGYFDHELLDHAAVRGRRRARSSTSSRPGSTTTSSGRSTTARSTRPSARSSNRPRSACSRRWPRRSATSSWPTSTSTEVLRPGAQARGPAQRPARLRRCRDPPPAPERRPPRLRFLRRRRSAHRPGSAAPVVGSRARYSAQACESTRTSVADPDFCRNRGMVKRARAAYVMTELHTGRPRRARTGWLAMRRVYAAMRAGPHGGLPRPEARLEMTAQIPVQRAHGNAYNIFILVLTIYSLGLMVLLFMPLDPDTRSLVTLYDNAICVIFLIDFGINLAGSHPKRAYFITSRGWLDLLGSIPSLGFIPFTVLFRLARLSRLVRISQHAGRSEPEAAHPGRARQPQRIRDLHHAAPGRDGPVDRQHPRAPGREPLAGRQHHDGRRCDLVGHRHDHDGGLRGRLPGHLPGSPDGGLRDGRRHRDHRRPGQHPRQRAGRTGTAGWIGAARAAADAGPAISPSAASSIAEELAGLRTELAGQRAEIAALRAALQTNRT